MLRLMCFKKLGNTIRNQTITPSKIHYLQNPSLKSNSKSKNPPPPSSSLIQCLINSYGLSQETALLTAEKVEFRTPKDPNKLLSFFKTMGFSQTHIGNIVSKSPGLLFSKPESRLLPKIQFFQQMGISDSDLIELLSERPAIFLYSLEKKIKPSFDLFRTLFGTDEPVVRVVRLYCLCVDQNFEQTLLPNVALLKNSGVPDHRISRLLRVQLNSLFIKSDIFKENLEKVTEMGFNPSTNMFLEAVRAVMSMKKSTWDAKFEVYRSFGWSDDEVLHAFRKHPSCLTISEVKIKKGLDFFMNELGWNKSIPTTYPKILSLSLEKRILPRYEVLRILFLKGLVEEPKTVKFVLMTEKMFLGTYVVKHRTKVPEILKALQLEKDFICGK